MPSVSSRRPILLPRILAMGIIGLASALSITPRLAAQRRPVAADHSFKPRYNPETHLLQQSFSSHGYHTTLTGGLVHSTTHSLQYALAQLESDEPDAHARAALVIRAVLALQDKDPVSPTHGIWPWYLEEPLEQMSPPDRNWADFCGRLLLQAKLFHLDKLPVTLLADVDAAIVRATQAIVKRDVAPSYTNIALLGGYVTLVAAELNDLPELKEYAVGRLRRFEEYTKAQGGFTEYNSPSYNPVVMNALAEILRDARDPAARQIAERLYHHAWSEVADHYHAPTGQWAGPHSRAYMPFSGHRLWSLIVAGTDGAIDLGVEPRQDKRLPLPCPEDLRARFGPLTEPRMVVQTYSREAPPVVGSTYLAPPFALGSISRGEMWNQRRPLLAYWGTRAAPASLRVRYLHDGYDFSDALFFSAQDEGRVLAAFSLGLDGGDTHVEFDRLKDGKVVAEDFRVRFEFGGAAKDTELPPAVAREHWWRVRFGDVWISARALADAFDGAVGRWELGREGDVSYLDYIIYHGERREFDLSAMDKAFAVFALELSVEQPSSSAEAVLAPAGLADLLRVEWAGLQLLTPIRPAPVNAMHRLYRP